MDKIPKILFLLLSTFIILTAKAQNDSSDMKLDIGWTRDKNMNLWPIVKYKKDTSIGFVKTDILFSIYSYSRNRELKEKYSHFYPLWRKKSNMDENDFRLFSIFYPSVYHQNYDYTTGIKSFNFLEIAPGISVLGFSKSADGLFIDHNLLFLLWFNKDEAKKSSYLIFFPVYWSFKNPQKNTNTFFPLWSTGNSNSGKSKYTAISPIFWHFEKNNKITNILFPIFWNYRSKDSVNNSKSNILFPIWFSSSNNYRQKRVLFPLVWQFKKPEYKSYTFLPLYSSGKDSAGLKKFLMVTPLYWNIKNDKERTKAFLPIWISFTNDYKKNRYLLPFVFFQKNKGYRSLTIFPLFSYGTDSTKTRKLFAVTPIFWHFKENEKTVNTIFPIFWDTKIQLGDNLKHKTVLFPIFFRFHDNFINNLTIFPILYKFKNQEYHSFTLLPLLSYGRSIDSTRNHFSIAAIYWQFKQRDDTFHILFPIWWNRDQIKWDGKHYSNVIFPIFWSFKNPEHINKVIFPIVWKMRNPYYKSFTFVPLFSYGHSPQRDQKHIIVSPVFWHLKNGYVNTTTIFPIVWHTKSIGEVPFKRNIVFPFWWSHSDSLNNYRILFPLVWSFKNEDYASKTLFPLFSAGKSMDGFRKYRIVTPLFWSFTSNESNKTVLFPFFDSKTYFNGNKNFGILYFLFRFKKEDDRKQADFLWPICQSKSESDLKYFRLAPIFWYKKSLESKFISVQPFYYQIKNSDFADYQILWQLFVFKKTYGKQKSWNFIWKTIYYEKYQPKGHEFRFLYLLFADVKKDNLVEKSFFPFYYFSKESNGNRSLSLFFYFYNSFRRQLPNTTEFYKEEKIFWFIRLRSNYKRLKAEGKL